MDTKRTCQAGQTRQAAGPKRPGKKGPRFKTGARVRVRETGASGIVVNYCQKEKLYDILSEDGWQMFSAEELEAEGKGQSERTPGQRSET